MADHGRANLRTATPRLFEGNDAKQQAYEEECVGIRSTMTVRFQTAPLVSVQSPRGRLIPPNTPVSVADFHGDGAHTAWLVLLDHVRAGRVLEADEVME